MAYLPATDEQKKKEEEQQQGMVMQQGALIDGAQSVGGNGAVAPQGAKPKGSGFVNIQDYIKANQGAPGVQGISNLAEQKIGKAQETGAQIGELGNQFQQQASTVPKFQDTRTEKIYDDEGYDTGETQDISVNPFESAMKGLSGKNDPSLLKQPAIDQWKKYLTASYGGPSDITSMQGYNPALKNVQELESTSKLTKSPEGVKTLLKQTAAPGRYTQGELGLDYAVTNPQMQGKFAQLRNAIDPLTGQLTNTAMQSSEQAKAAANQAAQTQAIARQAIEQARQNELAAESKSNIQANGGLYGNQLAARNALNKIAGYDIFGGMPQFAPTPVYTQQQYVAPNISPQEVIKNFNDEINNLQWFPEQQRQVMLAKRRYEDAHGLNSQFFL